MKIIVASTNPTKINSSKMGFIRMFPDINEIFIKGVSVDSGVSHQPMSDEETYKGAVNRAGEAKKQIPAADYWVGIEGGCEELDGSMEAFAWIVILDRKGKKGQGKTGTFILPKKVADLVRQGVELGEADDIIFKRKNSKLQNGAVGILTDNALDRTRYYREAVILALIPFKNSKLYER